MTAVIGFWAMWTLVFVVEFLAFRPPGRIVVTACLIVWTVLCAAAFRSEWKSR